MFRRPTLVALLGFLVTTTAFAEMSSVEMPAALAGQIAKLTADDAAADDQFGYSVAFSGTTALVGALLDVYGGTNSGSAHVFERDEGGAGNWGQVAKLTAADAGPDD